MKDLNKIFYDILIKLKKDSKDFELNKILCVKYSIFLRIMKKIGKISVNIFTIFILFVLN